MCQSVIGDVSPEQLVVEQLAQGSVDRDHPHFLVLRLVDGDEAMLHADVLPLQPQDLYFISGDTSLNSRTLARFAFKQRASCYLLKRLHESLIPHRTTDLYPCPQFFVRCTVIPRQQRMPIAHHT